MQEVKKVAVNVVLSDALAYLPNFFASLEAQEPKDFSIIMIDNASEDGAAKWVQDLYADVTVLRNFRNQGFARAANQAVELAWSRWPKENWADRFILMIDPAIELGANCLFHLTQILERDSSLTAVCPKILQTRVKSVAEDGRREVEHTDILYATGLFIDKFRRAVCRGEGERDRGQYEASSEVFGAPAVCGLFRASDLAKAKILNEIFDENLVDSGVDADLAWRARRLGLCTRFLPQALAYLQSSPRKLPQENKGRNHFWMIVKNDELGNVLLHVPWLLFSLLVFLASSFTSFARFMAMISALLGVPVIFKKRKILAGQIKIKGSGLRRWLI